MVHIMYREYSRGSSLALALQYNQHCMKMYHFLSVSISCSFTGRVSHHRRLQTAIKTHVQHWLCIRRERNKKEKRNEREREEVREGKCSAPPPLQNQDWYCLLIFITIAASCKMFDGFVQILVPLIHNYCYTCRTKGNFRRGAVWKAAFRL